MPAIRRLIISAATLCLAATGLLATGTPADAALPTPIAASTARTYLSELTVATESHQSTYDRSLFPTWITISGACDTREYVIKRDGTSVVTNSACTATSGHWTSPYDGVTTTDPSTFDIDHLLSVPATNQMAELPVRIVGGIPLAHGIALRTHRSASPGTATNLPAPARGV